MTIRSAPTPLAEAGVPMDPFNRGPFCEMYAEHVNGLVPDTIKQVYIPRLCNWRKLISGEEVQ